ncbi:hypothetical protein BH10BAC3_BH10BAC3_03770 [soil metagenome]
MNTVEMKERLIMLIDKATAEQLDAALNILDKRNYSYSANDLEEFKQISKRLETGEDGGFSYEEVIPNI